MRYQQKRRMFLSVWFGPGLSTVIATIALLFASLALITLTVYAQTAATGALAGTVTDPSGAIIPKANIRVINQGTGETRTGISAANGNFLIPLLPPGRYRVEVQVSGFKRATYPNIRVAITETSRLDIRLEIGSTSSEVTVQSEATQLQTDSSALGRVTPSELVQSLPLVTRNYTQIIGLSPGIAMDVNNAGQIGMGNTSNGEGAISAHGSNAWSNNFQMNGVEINDLEGSGHFSGGVAVPNPDSIQEFKVQTGQYDASYGLNSGANVDVVTKSGSNAFHGTLFEYFRNEALNANDFFRNETGSPRPVLRQNQFGFSLGGPVKKDKLLFFTSYQGTRQRNGLDPACSTSVQLPPGLTNDRSAAALGRLFAGQPTYIQLVTGAPLGDNVLPNGSNISPQALALMQMKLSDGSYLIPTPQTAGGLATFSSPCPFNDDQFIADLDYIQSDKSRFSGRFFFDDSSQTTAYPATGLGGSTTPGFPYVSKTGFRNFTLTHSYIFSPRLLNQAEIAYHRINSNLVQQEAFKFSDIGVNAPDFANPYPAISIAGAVSIGGNGQSIQDIQNTTQFQDTLFYTRGRHSLRFGGGLVRAQNNIANFSYFGGLIFETWPDFLLGESGTQQGLPLSNVVGSVDVPGLFQRAWRIWNGNLFAQDDIKVTSRFTLNLGFRYERLGDMGDNLGRNSTFDINRAEANPPDSGTLAGFVVANNFNGTVPDGVTKLDNNLAIAGAAQNTWNPRVGFAWQLPHTNRVVLRGGYGVYHDRLNGQIVFQLLASQPFGMVQQVVGVPNMNATFANPFPPTPALPAFTPYSPTTSLSLLSLPQGLRPPLVQNYSLNLQVEIAPDFMWEVGYVGSTGRYLAGVYYPNQAGWATTSNPIRGVSDNTLANIGQRVPIEGILSSGWLEFGNAGKSWYNSLQTSLTKRFSHGLQFLASYTFAKDLSTETGSTTHPDGGVVVGDQTDPSARYGPDQLTRQNRFVISYLYQLPGPKEKSSFVGHLLDGWQLAGVITYQSGHYLMATYNNYTNAYGITNDFAQLIPGCNFQTSGSVVSRLNGYVNTSCFTTPPVVGPDGLAAAFGNTRPGLLTGPGQANWDFALIKKTAVPWPREGASVEFRAEAFNLFNTPQFSDPDLNFSDATFGQILQTAVNPRILQFALRFNF